MYPLSTLLRGCWTEINLHLRLKLSFLRYRFILRKYSFLNNNNNNNSTGGGNLELRLTRDVIYMNSINRMF
jgi:hypothetical protein